MPPLNIDAAHATVIPSIPYSIVVSAADVQSSPGTDHPLWWVFTNEDHALVAMYALGTLINVVYPPGHTFNIPKIELFTGTPSSLTRYPPPDGLSIQDKAAVQVGFLSRPTTFYMKVTVAGPGPTEPVDDPLSLRVLPGRDITAELGAYVILSDQEEAFTTQRFPAQVFGADGQLKQSPTFVAGEQGYMFDDGTYAILNKLTSPEDLEIFNPDSTHRVTVPITGGGGALGGDAVSGDGTSTVFVAKSSVSVVATITSVDKTTGAIGSTWTLPSDSKYIHGSIAPNRAKTILYYQARGDLQLNTVHRYDLVGSAPLTDLAAHRSGQQTMSSQGIFVLKDGTIAVGYDGGVGNGQVVRYDTSGSVLNTYTLPNDRSLAMFSPYIDDPTTLLVWGFNAAVTSSRFYLVNVASGTFTQLGSDVPLFEDGVNLGDQSNSPPVFGVPFSCPLLVPRVPLTVPDTPPTVTITAPQPCCDAAPGGGPNPGPVNEAPPYTWLAQCPGGGLVPTAADIVNAEDWAA